jgi:hypothetical protein
MAKRLCGACGAILPEVYVKGRCKNVINERELQDEEK